MRAAAIAAPRQVELFDIGGRMKAAGLSDVFVADAVRTAIEFEGVYDLMVMWRDEPSVDEREEILADIQDMIDDCAQRDREEGVYIRFDDLDAVAQHIRKFKDSLLLTVNQQGGLKKLSEKTGIPQPSLSRFFNSASMPRRSTLLKIAKALQLDAVKIATEWSR